MTHTRSISFLGAAAAVPLAALAVAGCGGSSSSSNGAATASTPPAHTSNTSNSKPAQSVTVHTAQSRLGKILVDSRGRTLYLFKKDSGTKSACFGACATAWPPLRASGKPKAGSGVKASLLGTIKRSDGAAQVTYHGHPLYTFVMDKKAGDTNGEGVNAFGGSWFVVSPAGKQISHKPAKPAASSAATPPAPQPAPRPAAPQPKPQPKPSSSNGIPQNGGGDGDSDNNGGPSDGDGNI
jgi:predicted lipoprotein with Yx(FWY)xxD motif